MRRSKSRRRGLRRPSWSVSWKGAGGRSRSAKTSGTDPMADANLPTYPGYHVLNRCELTGQEMDFLLVDIRRIFTLSVDMVRELAAAQSPRVRLLPPYREHLSQAFARFFMRVGLPVDINPFK